MKKYNSHKKEKISIRRALLNQINIDYVVEFYGGKGLMYAHFWHKLPGMVFERNPLLVSQLALERPDWQIYECDTIKALQGGVASTIPGNILCLDCDPFGSPWPAIDTFFANLKSRHRHIAIVATDGSIQKIMLTGGWDFYGWEPFVQKYGNKLYGKFLLYSKERLAILLESQGYHMTWWQGYYGHTKKIAFYVQRLPHR